MVVTQLATPDLGEDTFRVVIEFPIPLEMPESLQVTQPAWIGRGRRRLFVAGGEKRREAKLQLQVTAVGTPNRQLPERRTWTASRQGTTQEQDDPEQDAWVSRLFMQCTRRRSVPAAPHGPQDPTPAEAASVAVSRRQHKLDRVAAR